ncbi:Rieske [2Fe-2S] domain/Rieske-like [2Fe-2S] domain containing protein [Novymonas esmeraldas]|uniref:Rieske [2Fe-2S] domain/Rieske-like [2Fe-2S] domain containing protein n=1 Tax=Novymonas esmeraldas TaxID=1808958 RepID=A0AAW0EMS7_9TRYP
MAAAPERVYVGKRTQLADGSRQLVRCGTRNIAVVCHRGALYAIDNACYHHGGPLLSGDIEEMGGHPCIVCPWHSYKIALDTGEGLYLGIEVGLDGSKPRQAVRSKGCKQRVHKVEVDTAGDVYVLVDLGGPKWESDAYASMELANRERPMGLHVDGGGGRGPRAPGLHSHLGPELRSGHVFQNLGALAAMNKSGGGSTGSGATNPFDIQKRTRPPMGLTLPAKPKSPGSVRVGAATSLMVSCVAVEDVCPGVREFHFAHHAGPLLRHAELGEYIELELPLREVRPGSAGRGGPVSPLPLPSSPMSGSISSGGSSSGGSGSGGVALAPMRRRWTISDVNRNGSLFSLIVKAAGTDAQTSGSAWLHHHALHAPLRVVRVGGTFTFADHHDTIRRVGGRVLWLTAGVGVTAAFAFLNSSLDDSFYVESAEPLHVVHLHANRTLETVPKLDELVRWQRRFPRSVPSTTTKAKGSKSYALELFITPAKAAATAAKREDDREDGRPRVGAVLSPSSNSIVTTVPLTHRARLQPAAVAAAVQTYFGADADPPLVYVCGPSAFVSDCADALLSAGVPESHILTDDP